MVGPLAKIGWGADIVVGEIAVLLELPEPLKILLIGDVAGERRRRRARSWCCTSRSTAASTSGRSSRSSTPRCTTRGSTGYPIAGDLAFRYGWGDQRGVRARPRRLQPAVPAAGGFPALKRLAISISSSVAKLEAQAYLALTSNTLQFGARVELTAGHRQLQRARLARLRRAVRAGPALLRVRPDRRRRPARRHGRPRLRPPGREAVSGPTPWHITGEASLSLLFFDVTVHFDKTWGTTAPALPAPDPLAALAAALCPTARAGAACCPAGARGRDHPGRGAGGRRGRRSCSTRPARCA